MDNQLLMEN